MLQKITLVAVGLTFIAAAIFVGVYVMLILGIVQVVTEIRAETMDTTSLCVGIARIIFFQTAGIIALPGYLCLIGAFRR